MKEYVFPINIIEEKNIKKSKNILEKQILQIGLNEKKLIYTNNKSSIILDFGMEMNGGIRILTYSSDLSDVRIRFGESVTECCEDIATIKNATNDHSVRDFKIILPSYSDQEYCNTGFRFVRLDFNGVLQIKNIVAKNNILSKKTIWTYSGNDFEVASIFKTAKRTIDLCASSDYVFDGVKRDRLIWYGDLHPEMLALTILYGRTKQIENSLDLARKEYPLPSWLNNFPSYSMWWIITVSDYYFMTKCKNFTKKQLSYLSKLAKQMDTNVNEDGTMKYPFYFLDWPTFETSGAIEGQRLINIIAMKKAIALLKDFNLPFSDAEKLLLKLTKKEVKCEEKKQIIALKCLAKGETNKNDFEKLILNGAEGFSTFMSYYILQAIAMYNKEKAIEVMKEYFGKMIEFGATTFWEDFDISWTKNSFGIDKRSEKNKLDIHGDFGAYCYKGFRHSLCHGWSTGIICLIKQYL